jgi:HEAT repeat protein
VELDDIRKALTDEDETERLYAVEDIISFEAAELLPDLIKALLAEKSRMVRELMVEALKKMDISPFYGDIAKFFESSEAYIRNCAIEIFGSKGEDAVAYLTFIMDHSDKEVRKLILDSLVATSSRYCIPALRAALMDKAPNVQITAVEYLGKIGDEGSLEDIIEIFETSSEPMLRISCIETFSLIAKPAIVDRALNVLGGVSMDSFYKPSVFRMVAEAGSEKHLEFLLSFLNNRNTLFFGEIANSILKIMIRAKVKRLPEETEKFIIAGMKNQNIETDHRITFMGILARLDMDGKEDIFEELSRDEEMNIVLSALDKLAVIDRDRTVKIIERKLKVAEGDTKEELINLMSLIMEQ